MIASRLFYLFISLLIFIYSIKIFAEFTSFAGILESGFMRLKYIAKPSGSMSLERFSDCFERSHKQNLVP